MYIAGITFAKISILILYWRIFNVDRAFRRVCVAVGIIAAGYGTSCVLAKIFICSPVKAGWTSHYKGPKHCADRTKINFTVGWFSIFTDFAIFIMPLPMLLKLNLARYKKLALCVIFMLGALCVSILDAHWKYADNTAVPVQCQ